MAKIVNTGVKHFTKKVADKKKGLKTSDTVADKVILEARADLALHITQLSGLLDDKAEIESLTSDDEPTELIINDNDNAMVKLHKKGVILCRETIAKKIAKKTDNVKIRKKYNRKDSAQKFAINERADLGGIIDNTQVKLDENIENIIIAGYDELESECFKSLNRPQRKSIEKLYDKDLIVSLNIERNAENGFYFDTENNMFELDEVIPHLKYKSSMINKDSKDK